MKQFGLLFLICALSQHFALPSDTAPLTNVDDSTKLVRIIDLIKELTNIAPIVPFLPHVGPSAAVIFEQVPSFVRQRIAIRGIPVYQLQVLGQSRVTMIQGTGDWTCGFHSLKNVLYVLNALQENPLTLQGANQLNAQLNDQAIFVELFLRGGTLQNPVALSWMIQFPAYQRSTILGNGIFPADQRILIERMRNRQCSVPRFVNNLELLERVFPLEQVFSADAAYTGLIDAVYLVRVVEGLRCLVFNEWPAIAFTLPASPQHFFGIIFHRVNTPIGLEIFVVDSLNSNLAESGQLLEQLMRLCRDVSRDF